jgi:hypothetical protein
MSKQSRGRRVHTKRNSKKRVKGGGVKSGAQMVNQYKPVASPYPCPDQCPRAPMTGLHHFITGTECDIYDRGYCTPVLYCEWCLCTKFTIQAFGGKRNSKTRKNLKGGSANKNNQKCASNECPKGGVHDMQVVEDKGEAGKMYSCSKCSCKRFLKSIPQTNVAN